MTSIPTGTAWRPYLRVLGETGLEVASAGAWLAAAELPPSRRRLVRAALMAVAAIRAIPAARTATADADAPTAPDTQLPIVDAGIRLPTDEDSDGSATRRRAVMVAVFATVAAGSVGAAVASRRLEQRWLERLVRQGHPHPHRGLGLRIAGLYAAVLVPTRLLGVRKRARGAQPG